MPEQAKNILTSFLRRLTNLSSQNRGLVLLRLSGDQFLDLHELSFLNQEKSFGIIESLIRGTEKKVCQVHDSRLESNNKASEKLKMLQRIDRLVFEERGTNDLHVGWPFVRGKFADGTPVRCPLMYFPVRITQQGQYWVLEPRRDAGITFNKAFLLAYSFYHKVKLEEDLLEFSFDDFDSDSTVFRTQLYQLLQDKIEINFNTENFQDNLHDFVKYSRAEFEELHRDGEIKLFPEAVLGIFPQAGSQLVPDYLHLLEKESVNDLEEFFSTKHAPGFTGPVKEEKLFTPFPIDAYQENAIHTIKKGNSIVVQGPPGTGKSQLICNLLADAIASGKRALLVCQKRAALDVVYERMKAVELSGFLGLVHDFRNDRKAIFEKMSRQIDLLEEYKNKNRGVDVIHTERKFFQVCRSIDQIAEELQEFKNALYDENECGLSIKELYLTSSLSEPSLNIKQEYHYFQFPELEDFVRAMKRYAQYARRYETETFPWRERKSFAHLQASDEQVLEDTVSDVIAYQKEIETQVFRAIGVSLNLEEAESFWLRKEEVLGMLGVLTDNETYRYFQKICAETEDETSLLWLSNMERVTLNCYDNDIPETTIPTDRLGKFQEALYERMKTRRNVFSLMQWELFSANKFVIKRVLVANDLAYNKYGLKVLEQRIDNRLNLEHHLTALRGKSWLLDIPSDYTKESLMKWFRLQKLAIRAKAIFVTLREVKDGINPSALSRDEFHSLFRSLLDMVKNIPEQKSQWQRYLSPFHIRQLILDPSTEENLKQSLRQHFDNLCDFDLLKENMRPAEHEVMKKLHEAVNDWDGQAMDTLLQNSLRLAWIDHIEVKYPVLRSVSSLKMEELQSELQRLVEEKQKLSQDILLLRAREKAYEGITYNRLNNRVTYRDLHHQVIKKKKIWPLRKVISAYHEEIFQLLPVWMASPESVSAIFPMEPLFDLVIFDEASQCFAERGIPAMYRGKQVLIAGDAQQLRPSELYQVRWVDDENENPDAEVESLLDLAARYLPTVHLQGHYRSKSLELMEFSNRHFYEQRLRLLPDRKIMNMENAPIVYHKVDGVWENQTNEPEAKAVAATVFDLLKGDPDKEIGIVTFNAPQQNLILDILEAEAKKEAMILPASLLVKNIENVQGDEKDIIIFSVGYAPDKKGNLSMQFGSLNAVGGENRLNVAVTRAREKIILITSIWPEQLKTQEAKNAGPRLFRDYLEFARAVSDGTYKPALYPKGDYNSTWYLSSRLKSWGNDRLSEFNFEENSLPYVDLNVRKDDRYLGVILTDDERFHKSLSVKDTFAYTPALLQKKNWNHRMVYSRQFWKDTDAVENTLMTFVGTQV